LKNRIKILIILSTGKVLRTISRVSRKIPRFCRDRSIQIVQRHRTRDVYHLQKCNFANC